MDVGAFFRGRLGLWRTAGLIWLIIAVFLLAKGQVWTGLHKLDTDDAMRLVETRDWLAGQGWFDTTQHRGWPAPGYLMHWSRIPDLWLGGLILLFGLVMPAGLAELTAMIVWPLAQLAVALVLVGLIARRLGGARAMAPAMILFGLLGPAFWQFHPGRVDHHALQLIGVLAMAAATLNLRRSAWAGVAAGLGGAVSLAVGLEGLMFWLLLCGAAGLVLARDGARVRAAVIAFGLTVAVATPVLALATNPTRYVLSQVCDQVAMPVLALAMVGGLGLAVAGALAGGLRNAWARLAVVSLVGLAAAAAFVVAGPDCVRGPFANMDPRLGPIWIDHVQEAHTLPWLLRQLDPFGVASAVMVVLGLAATGLMLARRPALFRPVAIMGMLLLATVGMLFMQMRGITYTVSFACPLLAAALVVGARDARTPPLHWGAVMLAGLIVLIGIPQVGRVLAGLAAPKPAANAPQPAEGCFDPVSYAGLAGLEPGLAVAPIDSGPFILMSSPLSIMSAPYHRNPEGIVAGNALMSAPPQQAQALARAHGVDYVVFCRSGEVLRQMRLTPQSLAARLDAADVPAWLSPVATGAGPVRVYRVVDGSRLHP